MEHTNRLASRAGLPLAAARLWVLLSAYCSVAGWALSALGMLTAAGWAVAFALFLAGFVVAKPWRQNRPRPAGFRLRALWRRRFRRPLPFLFAVLAAVALLRGLANPGVYPADANAYRIPRVLHWLAERHWYWIATNDARMDNRGVGFEWLTSPVIAWTGSDHWLFLLTWVPFCLLPGVIFIAFRNLGVRPRVAWNWAWIAPMIHCVVFQAGTGMSDGFNVFYAVAAVAFALEARRRGRVGLLFYALLAGAFLSGIKASNIPLLLPIGLAILPALPLARRRILPLLGIGAIALTVSFLPMATINWLRLGDWSGLSSEGQILKPVNPAVAAGLNSVFGLAYFVAPPILPLHAHSVSVFAPISSPAFQDFLASHFEADYGVIYRRTDDSSAGAGFTVALALLPFAFVVLRRWLSGRRVVPGFDWETAIRLAAWVSLAAILAKSTVSGLPRILAPYYPLLLPTFLVGAGAEAVVRRRWWRWLAGAAVLLCLPMICLSTTTPPWPVAPVIHALERTGAASRGPVRAFVDTYGLQTRLDDLRAELAAQLPPDQVLGLIRPWQEEEAFYWRPYGSRRIEQVPLGEDSASLRRRGIEYVIWQEGNPRLDAFARGLDAEVAREFSFGEINGYHFAPIRLLKIRQKD